MADKQEDNTGLQNQLIYGLNCDAIPGNPQSLGLALRIALKRDPDMVILHSKSPTFEPDLMELAKHCVACGISMMFTHFEEHAPKETNWLNPDSFARVKSFADQYVVTDGVTESL